MSSYMTLPAYIKKPASLTVAGYAGNILTCHFVLEQYQDSDFVLAGIALPARLQNAVAKRKAEYLAGRCLVRLLLRKAGVADTQLVSGADRAPCWPAGVCGAISHNHHQALCALSNHSAVSGTGIDVENVLTTARATKLAPSIISQHEQAWIDKIAVIFEPHDVVKNHANSQQNSNFAIMLTLAFSAKESLFKAVYPHVKRYFSFHDARLCHIDPQQHRFSLRLTSTLNPAFPAGRVFSGHYFYDGQSIITFLHF